ncbi:DUF6221 family protein [Streptomyces pristinaespiralis]|uniref:DUF6221 family protein n=1 Tax=Streptomyces pristinaespiralis TaxID=38300 RepID=UPI0037A2A37D
MSDDLVKFLRARLNEVEARVRALPDGPWEWKTFDDSGSDALVGPDGTVLCSGDAEGYKSWIDRHEAFDAYLQDIQPARVLAEVETKRHLLDEHQEGTLGCAVCAAPEDFDEDSEGNAEWSRAAKWWPCPTLRLLALPYADHPDYLEEWRP